MQQFRRSWHGMIRVAAQIGRGTIRAVLLGGLALAGHAAARGEPATHPSLPSPLSVEPPTTHPAAPPAGEVKKEGPRGPGRPGGLVSRFLEASREVPKADEARKEEPRKEEPRREAKPAGQDDKLVVTRHELRVGGRLLRYQATAGTLAMKDEAGKPRANFFFVAYQLDPAEGKPADGKGAETQPASGEAAKADDAARDLARRPLTFVFNGGPGAAAVWLHLGALGPKKVALDDAGNPLGPPYRLQDNASTWLDLTDLVFIDPVGTGYSRPAEGVKGEEFFGVNQDISSVADFIRLYTTRFQRWPSPKFLAGESYGTTRAAGLSDYLLDRYGIELNGIVFISSVLNFATLQPGAGNDLPYLLFLPTYTATAGYHRRLEPDVQKQFDQDRDKLLAEVQRWVMSDYLPALGRGDGLSADERAEVVRRLGRYSGLSADFIDKANLRLDPSAFRKRLLNDRKRLIGRFDARLSGEDMDPATDSADYDPSFPRYFAQYSATFNDYARRELKYESDLNYEVLTNRVHPWSFDRGGHGYLDVAGALRSAMVKSPRMKVMFVSGLFDLATPYFATDFTLDHLGLSREIRANVTRTLYAGGHMVYHPKEGLERLKADAAKFYARAAGDGGRK